MVSVVLLSYMATASCRCPFEPNINVLELLLHSVQKHYGVQNREAVAHINQLQQPCWSLCVAWLSDPLPGYWQHCL